MTDREKLLGWAAQAKKTGAAPKPSAPKAASGPTAPAQTQRTDTSDPAANRAALKSWAQKAKQSKQTSPTAGRSTAFSAPAAPKTTHVTPTALTYRERQQVKQGDPNYQARRPDLAVEDARREVEAAKKVRDAARDAATGVTVPYAVRRNNEGLVSADQEAKAAQQRLSDAQKRVDEAEVKLTRLAGEQYETKNQAALQKTKGDPATGRAYASAREALQDQRDLNDLAKAYGMGATGDPDKQSKQLEIQKRLESRYGLTYKDLVDYSRGDASGLQRVGKKIEDAINAAQTTTGEAINVKDLDAYERRKQAQKEAEQRTAEQAAFADEHPVIASAGSVGATLFQPLDILNVDWGRGDPGDPDYIPPDTSNMVGTQAKDTARGTVAQGIRGDGDNIFRKAAAFFYDTGMSAADSVSTVALLGPGSLALMGTNAAVSEGKNIIDRGGTREQAILGGLASGAAEVFFEKFSVDQLLKPKDITGWKSFVKEGLKQGGVEASEEMATEIANIFSDTAIMGANSNFNNAVRAYMADGMSEEAAKQRAYLDQVGQVVMSGLGGFLSGTMTSTVYNAPGAVANAVETRRQKVAAQVGPETTAVDTDPEGHTTEEMETISAYQNAVDKGIKGFVARVRTLQNKKYRNKVRYTISEVSEAAATTVKGLTGVDPTGFTNILTGGAVDHIDHRHGKDGQADSSMADDNDLARVQFVLDHFDGAKLLTDENGEPSLSNVWKNSDGTQARRVMFYKKIDGTYYVVEAAPDSNAHVLAIESAYIGTKAQIERGTGTVLNMAPKGAPQVTPETPQRANTSLDDSIPQTQQGVNPAGSVEAMPQTEREVIARYAQTSETLGEMGREVIGTLFEDGQDGETYVTHMRAVYQAGRDGQRLDSLEPSAVRGLTDDQVLAAYTAGQADAELDLRRRAADQTPPANSQALGNLDGDQVETEEDYPFYFGSEDAPATGAGKGVINDEQAGTVRVRDGGQRLDGAGAQGEAGPVAKGTVAALPRADRRGPADAGAGALQVGGKISSYELGVVSGIRGDALYRVTGGATEDLTQARRLAAGRGLELVAFAGGNLHMRVYDRQGKPTIVEARAYISGNKLYVRADHAEFSALQLYRHEEYHDREAHGEVDTRKTMESVRETLGDELAAKLEAMYSRAAGGMEGLELWEEIAADQYAGMNVFSGAFGTEDIEALQTQVGAQTDAQLAAKTETAAATDRRTGPPEGKTSIEHLPDGRSYVKADRQVIFGNDPQSWRGQLEDYINGKIRRGEDVALIAEDGDVLLLTAETAGKVSSPYRGDGTTLSDAEYERKVNAGVHIDELVRVSRSQGKTKDDVDGRHGEFASGGWDYRDAYFLDFDGKYYQVTISAAVNDDGTVVYNIGKMRKRSFPNYTGSSAKGGAHGVGKASPSDSVAQDGGEVKDSFSREGDQAFVQELRDLRHDVDVGTLTVAAARERLDAMIEEYGAIKPGENPAREIAVPKRTAKDKKVSQTVRTILEGEVTPDVVVPSLEELTANGDFSYEVYTDKAAMKDAEIKLKRKGWDKTLAAWTADVKKGVVSKENTSMGWLLYNNAVNDGNVQTALDILDLMVKHQRNAAQAVQATRILKKMVPDTQLYNIQRSVWDLQDELNKRYGDKKSPKLKIPEDLAEDFMMAETQDERERVLHEIGRAIGRQVPSTLGDKWNAWRYLAMLGNPKTHIRNIVGNAGFMPVVAAKDLTATAIEAVVGRVSGGRLERTKGAVGLGKGGRALLKAAWGDYANVRAQALGEGKYSDRAVMDKDVEAGRRIFKSRVLEGARRGNGALMDLEDAWFSQPHYAYALAQFCKANGITVEELAAGDPAGLAKARAYAVREAQKATYRDTNAFSQWVSAIGRPGKDANVVKKTIGVAMEGVLPFRKTPANILARGVEYSPIGLVKSLGVDLPRVAQGKMTGAEAIDHISAGLTGTGLMMLGVFLAAQGLVRGGGGDDDKKKEFEELQGHQDYALEVGGMSVTLDWLAPEALPFFIGVNLYEQTQGDWEDVKMEDLLRAAGSVTEPLLEMSCLQSLNDLLETVQYGDTDGVVSMAASAATSYLTQALPTLLGQVERSGEGERMTTYTDKNKFITTDMQYAIGRASAKIPGLDYGQIPYIDAWGRAEDTGSLLERIVNNFINPAYTDHVDTRAMENELLRLYEATGESGVFPKRVSKYFNVNGKRKDLTAEEYVKYATVAGTEARRLVTELTASREYREMDNDERVHAVEYAYQLARKTGQGAVAEVDEDSWMTKAREAKKKYDIDEDTYISLKAKTRGIEGLKDQDGETIANSKGLQIMEVVYDAPGLNDKQRRYLFEAFGVGKTVLHYNKLKVQEKLKYMR